MTQSGRAWVMQEPGSLLRATPFDPRPPAPGEALIQVAGCGVCHTDIGFLHDGVPTRRKPPLTLGHEVAGVVAEVGDDARLHDGPLLEPGRQVIVPAVLPCGDCPVCRTGRENMCPSQKMPGNDLDGGFATHMTVPARFLVPVDDVPVGHDLAHLAVVADAVTTPYQALRRAGVGRDDPVVVIGTGGIGIYGVQIAAARGASVLAVDLQPAALERARSHGAAGAACTAGLEGKAARDAVRTAARDLGWPRAGWKILEMSGSPAGQLLAWSLLSPGATLAVVGFTPKKVEVRLSNLMAFDADAFGSWGCPPELYPEAVELVTSGRIDLRPFVRRMPMERIEEAFEMADAGEVPGRIVLVPQTEGATG